jgi:integrase
LEALTYSMFRLRSGREFSTPGTFPQYPHDPQNTGFPQSRNRLPQPASGDLVFPSNTGSLLDPSNRRNHSFKRIKARAGVREDLRFHDLRHTCATLLLREGVNPKVVSEMLGHASITITLNTYSHVLPDMQDSAANAMEAALGAMS